MSFPLSLRLNKALELVPEGAVVLDVGSDRGDFLLALEERGHKVYGCENKKGPYLGLVENLKRHGSKAVALFQDGAANLPEDVDTLTILGMGGRTMKGILERMGKKIERIRFLVLSPQSAFEEPILFLDGKGFENTDGLFIHETRDYPILLFVRSAEKKALTKEERLFGRAPIAKKDPVLQNYLKTKLARLSALGKEGRRQNEKERLFLEETLNHL